MRRDVWGASGSALGTATDAFWPELHWRTKGHRHSGPGGFGARSDQPDLSV